MAGLEQHFYDTADSQVQGLPGPHRPQDLRRPGPGRARPADQVLPLPPAGGRDLRPAHRLRQRGQSASRPRERPAERARHPGGAGRRPRRDRQAALGREPSPDACGGRARRSAWRSGPSRRSTTSRRGCLPDMLPIAIDRGVLGYAVGVSVAVGLLIGLLPVVHILRSNLAEVIHRSSRSASGGRGVRALSSMLVTGQIAVALVLLSGAGLLIHSFANAISSTPDSTRKTSSSEARPAVPLPGAGEVGRVPAEACAGPEGDHRASRPRRWRPGSPSGRPRRARAHAQGQRASPRHAPARAHSWSACPWGISRRCASSCSRGGSLTRPTREGREAGLRRRRALRAEVLSRALRGRRALHVRRAAREGERLARDRGGRAQTSRTTGWRTRAATRSFTIPCSHDHPGG